MPKPPKRRKRNLDKARVRASKNEPHWKGPYREGVSQSMLCKYLCCKERFRIWTIDGLGAKETYRVPIEYGNYWHLCEEKHAEGLDIDEVLYHLKEMWREKLVDFRQEQKQVTKWYNVCRVQFPLYVDYWTNHPDTEDRIPLLQEEDFKCHYKLPSGRIVVLRGKWDSVDLVSNSICLQENKSKYDADDYKIEKQLRCDIQTMIYLIALKEYQEEILTSVNDGTVESDELIEKWSRPINKVRYNVIRRPLSGGKGNIRPHKAKGSKPAETMEQFYNRLHDIIKEDLEQEDNNTYFKRWNVDIDDEDIERFRFQVLNPILENLCDDYEWWEDCKGCNELGIEKDPFDYSKRPNHHSPRHFVLPYGIYNVVGMGGFSELDDYVLKGSTVGLTKVKTFFPELEDA